MKDKFNLIFGCTVGLTIVLGAMLVTLAVWGPDPQPPAIASLFDTLKYGFTMGLFSLFGLLGVKNQAPPPSHS